MESVARILIPRSRESICADNTLNPQGHVKMKSTTMGGLIAKHGEELAMEVRDLVTANIYALKDVVETEDLDCEFELRRSYDVFVDEDDAAKARKDFKAALKTGQRWTRDIDLTEGKSVEQVRRKLHFNHVSLDTDCCQVTSIKGAKLALSSSICSLWPYKFV